MTSRILHAGFSIRVRPDQPDADWTDARRDQYLLRTDVRRPLAVDHRVWGALHGAADVLPWNSIESVRARRDKHAGADAGLWVVVVLGFVAADPEQLALIDGRVPIDKELVVDPTRRFLGFDISDAPRAGTSGLSNCGYEPGDETAALRSEWAPRLNEHGLFDHVDDAIAFRALTDCRVVEHAPFFVVGMWIVG